MTRAEFLQRCAVSIAAIVGVKLAAPVETYHWDPGIAITERTIWSDVRWVEGRQMQPREPFPSLQWRPING